MSVNKSLYEEFIIESGDGSKTVDIAAGVVNFTYYENLFSPVITARIVVVNTGGVVPGKDGKLQSLYNGLPLRGGERVSIKIAANSGTNQSLDFTDLNWNFDSTKKCKQNNLLIKTEIETLFFLGILRLFRP